jgi:O-acetyl-ADP-ribose deacetylase (regulator of RNase III)
MIDLVKGDILKADAEALVNTVNCVGVIGRGIALQFKKAFPENYKAYKAACDKKEVNLGKVFTYDLNRLYGLNPRFIINFPTKGHWKSKSRIQDIESGLTSLVEFLQKEKIRSIAIPPLGCGLGGLHWKEVKPLIVRTFESIPEITVFLFEPAGAPQSAEIVKTKEMPKMTVGRAALVGLMRRYLSAVMDPTITLLEVHKLMYFMQESGEPLRLRYQKAHYGPYAQNLRHVLSLIDGHFVHGYGDGQDQPDKSLELDSTASSQAEIFLKAHEETKKRFDNVADLIKGFETTFGMELLSTVHWVVTREKASTSEEVIKKVHAWDERKHMFEPFHIELAWNRLCEKGMLSKDLN